MNRTQRLFGTGPRGLAVSVALLALTAYLAPLVQLPALHGEPALGQVALALASLLTLALVVWSVRSLPVTERGRSLATGGAYRYVRHPLYAAFLLFFDFGLAVYLDNWLYVLWALLLHPVWHLNIRGEEALMREAFAEEYDAYCAVTGRFFPRLHG